MNVMAARCAFVTLLMTFEKCILRIKKGNQLFWGYCHILLETWSNFDNATLMLAAEDGSLWAHVPSFGTSIHSLSGISINWLWQTVTENTFSFIWRWINKMIILSQMKTSKRSIKHSTYNGISNNECRFIAAKKVHKRWT